MKKILILLFLLSAFGNASAQESVPKKEIPIRSEESAIQSSRSRWDLVWRSAVLPGWGLLYAKAYRKGFWTAGITTLLIGAEIRGHREEEEQKEKFSESQKLLQFSYLNQPGQTDQNLLLYLYALDAGKDLDHIRKNNEFKLTLLGLKYFLQLGYTYWFGISWEQESEKTGFKFDIQKDSFSVGSNSNAQKFLLSYEFTF